MPVDFLNEKNQKVPISTSPGKKSRPHHDQSKSGQKANLKANLKKAGGGRHSWGSIDSQISLGLEDFENGYPVKKD